MIFYFGTDWFEAGSYNKTEYKENSKAEMMRSKSVETIIRWSVLSWSSSGSHSEHFWYFNKFIDMFYVSDVVSGLWSFKLRSVRDCGNGISGNYSEDWKKDCDFHFLTKGFL